jgi:hypothetical protein
MRCRDDLPTERAAFAELARLSRTSIEDVLREEHRRCALGE